MTDYFYSLQYILTRYDVWYPYKDLANEENQ